MKQLRELTDDLSSKICRLLNTAGAGSVISAKITREGIEGRMDIKSFPLFALLIVKACVQHMDEFGSNIATIEDFPGEFVIKWTKLEDKILVINTLDVDDTLNKLLNQ